MHVLTLCLGASLLSVAGAGSVLALYEKMLAYDTSVTGNHRRDTASSNEGSSILERLSNVADRPSQVGQNLSDHAVRIKSQVQQYRSIQQTANSSSVDAAFATISSIFQNGVPDLTLVVEELLSQGLLTGSLLDLLNGYADLSLNSDSNDNPKSPATPIYPSKSSGDAPYSVDETALRSAIYIPESFTYGANGRIPVILVPGTAVPAGITYYFSFGKLGSAADVDPVWVNIPKASLGDVQVNAEYVAYAINYISGISSSSNVSVISWSQGGLDTQWALKYWPSTRNVVSDFVAISPDFHGTIEASFICLGLPSPACTPSIAQQEYTSKFINTIRADGGDSAYVPTTTLYSSFDEIVEPMSGADASAFLQDTRGVGVTNVWAQATCAGKPAGGIYTHEGMLYSPLSWALAIDAITYGGPGDPLRVDLDQVCSQVLAPGLEISDLLGTEGLLLIAVAEILAYGGLGTDEPPIAAYAQ